MPWLVGGGVLLALLFGSSKAAAAPVQYAPALPPPQPYAPTPSLSTHLATVLAQPKGVAIVRPAPAPSAVFTGRPYGSKPVRQLLEWWVNHYTGSDYTSGETIHPTDLADAVHNALHHATLSEVNELLAFADVLGQNTNADVSASADSDEVRQYVLGLQSDAIAPFVSQYAGVHNWPTSDPTNLSDSPAEKGDRNALHTTIAAVTKSGNRQDAMNLGELLDGYVDFGVDWTDAGALLVAFANHPSTMPTAPPPVPGATSFAPTAIRPSAPAAKRVASPPPPAKTPIAHTPPAAPHPTDATDEAPAPPPADSTPATEPAPSGPAVQADVSADDVGSGAGGPSLGGG